MIDDVSPILDRHTQERLGRDLREKFDSACTQRPCREIESLLASLRAAEERSDDRRQHRR
jgi:hypothetical protein